MRSRSSCRSVARSRRRRRAVGVEPHHIYQKTALLAVGDTITRLLLEEREDELDEITRPSSTESLAPHPSSRTFVSARSYRPRSRWTRREEGAEWMNGRLMPLPGAEAVLRLRSLTSSETSVITGVPPRARTERIHLSPTPPMSPEGSVAVVLEDMHPKHWRCAR